MTDTTTERPFESTDFRRQRHLNKYTKADLGELIFSLLHSVETIEADAKKLHEEVVADECSRATAYGFMRSNVIGNLNAFWWGVNPKGKPLTMHERQEKHERARREREMRDAERAKNAA